MKVALTGGIACGKSLAAKYLNEFGIETIDADDVVHELIPDADERRRIAAEVFADPEKRKALEAKIHPVVKDRIEAFFASGEGKTRVAVVPLLFEVRWEKNFDIICCVVSAREVQISRMTAMRGYTRDEAEARLAAQMPVEEKARKSHYVIRNNGSADELKLEVERFASWLKNSMCSQRR